MPYISLSREGNVGSRRFLGEVDDEGVCRARCRCHDAAQLVDDGAVNLETEEHVSAPPWRGRRRRIVGRADESVVHLVCPGILPMLVDEDAVHLETEERGF